MSVINPQEKWIRRAHLRNFQSHVDTDVDLTPGINLIVGTSHIGKSSLLRAINFVLHNEVPNREFVTHGAKNAHVTLEYNDGTIVERIKGEENSYKLILPDGSDTVTFARVGTDIPKEVYEAMGCPPMSKQHGPISYSEQHAPLFLVSLTSTELPRAISQLTGCDDFEQAATLLGKRAKQYDKQIKSSVERTARMETELAAYDELENDIELCRVAGDALEEFDGRMKRIEDASALAAEYADVMEEGKRISAELKKSEAVLAVKPRVSAIVARFAAVSAAKDLVAEYEAVNEEINRAETSLAKAERISKLNLGEDIARIRRAQVELAAAKDLLERYALINSEGKKAKEDMAHHATRAEECRAELASLRVELISSGAMCDKCGQLVKGGASG